MKRRIFEYKLKWDNVHELISWTLIFWFRCIKWFFWVSNLNFQWIFGFTLEMNGLVLEIAFEYDKAIQIQRLWNSIRMSSSIRNNIIHLRNSWHYKTRFRISFWQKHFGCHDDEVTKFCRIQFQLIGLNYLSLHLNRSTEVKAVQCISSWWQIF